MQSRWVRIAQFWIVLIWTLFVIYLAYLGWPGSYGPEFGEFLVRISSLGLCCSQTIESDTRQNNLTLNNKD